MNHWFYLLEYQTDRGSANSNIWYSLKHYVPYFYLGTRILNETPYLHLSNDLYFLLHSGAEVHMLWRKRYFFCPTIS